MSRPVDVYAALDGGRVCAEVGFLRCKAVGRISSEHGEMSARRCAHYADAAWVYVETFGIGAYPSDGIFAVAERCRIGYRQRVIGKSVVYADYGDAVIQHRLEHLRLEMLKYLSLITVHPASSMDKDD